MDTFMMCLQLDDWIVRYKCKKTTKDIRDRLLKMTCYVYSAIRKRNYDFENIENSRVLSFRNVW